MNRLAGSQGDTPAIAICIPVRDEVARLPRLFDALEQLVVPAGASVRACLLLDGCVDGSADAAASYRRRSRHMVRTAAVERSPSNAGIARHRAMRLGMEALGPAGGILLTTDADSWPRRDWLEATTSALDHADVVAGNVVRRGGGSHAGQDRIERYYTRLFALRRRADPVGWESATTHHHASGANIAIRSDVYDKLGGFAPLVSGEDARLIDDASRAGLWVRRDAASVVYTSDRRDGRAQGGLATTLTMLDRQGLAGVCVTHPADQLWQYDRHALARRAFATADFNLLAGAIDLAVDHILGVARDCPNAEAFAMRVVPIAPQGMRQVTLAVAEAVLATLAAATPPAQAA